MPFFKKKEKIDDNHRIYKRHSIFQSTYYKLEDSSKTIKDCMIQNISQGGMLLVIEENLDIGTHLIIIANFNGQLIQEKLIIVRKQKMITKKYGCVFADESSKENRETILKSYFESL